MTLPQIVRLLDLGPPRISDETHSATLPGKRASRARLRRKVCCFGGTNSSRACTEVTICIISTRNDNSITSLYTLQVRYLLSTLNQIPKCLEELTDAASDRQLKETFHSHLLQVGLQRERLDQILLELTSKVVAKKCAVTAALIATVEKIRETDRGFGS